jgi:hypothetical protein
MLGASEDLAAIGAFTLEHTACIMQAMREYADLGFGGWDQLAVEPDKIRPLVEGHCHGIASIASLFQRAALGRDGFCTDTADRIWSAPLLLEVMAGLCGFWPASAAQNLRHSQSGTVQSGTVPERPGIETILHWQLNNRAKICQHS